MCSQKLVWNVRIKAFWYTKIFWLMIYLFFLFQDSHHVRSSVQSSPSLPTVTSGKTQILTFSRLCHIIIHKSKSIYSTILVNTTLDCKFCCSSNNMQEVEQYAFEKRLIFLAPINISLLIFLHIIFSLRIPFSFY